MSDLDSWSVNGENAANYARDCDVCGCGISHADLKYARHEAPDYMPDDFRKQYGVQYFCESCCEGTL